MTDPQHDPDLASRWQREAAEELRAAEVVAAHDELPDRVAGFHAHLAPEKALKAVCRVNFKALIDRGYGVAHALIETVRPVSLRVYRSAGDGGLWGVQQKHVDRGLGGFRPGGR